MNGPLTPEQAAELERARAYYSNAGTMSSAATPAPAPEAAPAPQASAPVDEGTYWGLPSKAIPAGPAPTMTQPEPPPEPQIDKFGNPITVAQTQVPASEFKPMLNVIGNAAAGIPAAPPPAAPPQSTTIPEVTVQSSVPPRTMMPAPGVLTAANREIQARTAAGEKPRGGPGNPDPFGVKAATTGLLGTYGEQREAMMRGAAAAGHKALVTAEGEEQFARRMEEDAAIDRAQAQLADDTFAEHMNEVQNQLDEVRAKKIDPTRVLKDKGLGLLAIVAGVAGGIYQGINHLQSNPFLDDLHRTMNEDMKAQQLEIENGRAAVSDQLNLLGQMRAVYKDHQLADMQARNLIYEATKQGIAAEAGRSDDAIIKADADQKIALVEREQAALQKQIAEQARAQAAAAAAQQMAQVKAQRERMDKIYGETYDKALAAFKDQPDAAAKAEFEARRMVEMLMGGGTGPRPASAPTQPTDVLANVPKAQQEHAAKELEAHAKAEKGVATLNGEFAKWRDMGTVDASMRQGDAIKASVLALYKGGLGPGFSSDKDAENFLAPLVPKMGDSAETLALKQKLIADSIRSNVATPIIDMHNPGWRGPAPVQHFDASGKPK